MTPQQRYRAAHPERAKASDKASKARCKAKNQAYARKRNRVLAGCVDATDETRDGECPICLRTGALVWDHDHETGKFRGWICDDCNVGLGRFADDAKNIERALTYLNEIEHDNDVADEKDPDDHES